MLLPTKRNLQLTKRSLVLATQAYNLLDKKHKVLLKEFNLNKNTTGQLKNQLCNEIEIVKRLTDKVRLQIGDEKLEKILAKIQIDTELHLEFTSIMGVPIPEVKAKQLTKPPYELHEGTSLLDNVFTKWLNIKTLAQKLAESETSMNNLSKAIKKAQKRAAGLKNIVIPTYEHRIKYISEQIEERERDDLARTKFIVNRT